MKGRTVSDREGKRDNTRRVYALEVLELKPGVCGTRGDMLLLSQG